MKFVAEITYLTWTADNLLRHTVYVGLREDKPAGQVRRETASAIARPAPIRSPISSSGHVAIKAGKIDSA
jgi:ATP-dependent DNA ligase